nr:MAG TPA: hypothetical protein [Microviridae sp.]
MAIIVILNLSTEKIDLRKKLLKLTFAKRNISTFESLSNTSIDLSHTISKRNTFDLQIRKNLLRTIQSRKRILVSGLMLSKRRLRLFQIGRSRKISNLSHNKRVLIIPRRVTRQRSTAGTSNSGILSTVSFRLSRSNRRRTFRKNRVRIHTSFTHRLNLSRRGVIQIPLTSGQLLSILTGILSNTLLILFGVLLLIIPLVFLTLPHLTHEVTILASSLSRRNRISKIRNRCSNTLYCSNILRRKISHFSESFKRVRTTLRVCALFNKKGMHPHSLVRLFTGASSRSCRSRSCANITDRRTSSRRQSSSRLMRCHLLSIILDNPSFTLIVRRTNIRERFDTFGWVLIIRDNISAEVIRNTSLRLTNHIAKRASLTITGKEFRNRNRRQLRRPARFGFKTRRIHTTTI